MKKLNDASESLNMVMNTLVRCRLTCYW